MKGSQVPLREDLDKMPKSFTVSLFCHSGLMVFYTSKVGERKQSEFLGLLDAGSKFILISGDPKKHVALQLK